MSKSLPTGIDIMKSKLRSALIQSVLLFSLVSGCKPDNLDFGVPASGELISVEIKPAAPSMAPGTTLQLEAIGKFSNNTTRTITKSSAWTSENFAVASVSSAGLVSADPSGTGQTVIIVTAEGLSSSVTVTLATVASIAVTTDGLTMAPGTALHASAIGTLQNSATQDLTNFATWTSSDSAVAGITGPGVISAASQITGTATITAALGSVDGTSTLRVAPISSIAVTPANISVAPGKVQNFSATAIFSGNEKQNITEFAIWSSLPSDIFAITRSGVGISVEPGSAIITAAFGGAQASAVVSVDEPIPVFINIVPEAIQAEPGASLRFSVFGAFSDGSVRDLTQDAIWATSDLQLASVSNVSGFRGLVSPLAAGTVRITANCFGTISPAAILTIVPVAVFTPITITPANTSIRWGSSLQFTALSFSGINTAENVTSAATWSSSDESVVFVAQGYATALRPGFATITATFGHFSASTRLSVTSF
jgi:hypothetical protein